MQESQEKNLPAHWTARMRHRYLLHRFVNGLIPSHLQRTPWRIPVEHSRLATADGVDLAVTWITRGHPTLLIICHGFGATRRSTGITWLAENLSDHWDMLLFDWRGNGGSGGHASFGGDEVHDISALLAAARARGYQRIGLIGESLGGGMAMAALSELTQAEPCPVDRIALLAAPADFQLTGGSRPVILKHLAHRRWVRPFSRPLLGFRLGQSRPVRPLDAAMHISVPVLITQGDNDAVVPVINAYAWARCLTNTTLHIYQGVRHGVEAMRVQIPQVLLHDVHAHFAAMT